MKYIALPSSWFEEGTEVKLIDDYRLNGQLQRGWDCGLFEGIHEGKLDQEVCPFDEFRATEE